MKTFEELNALCDKLTANNLPTEYHAIVNDDEYKSWQTFFDSLGRSTVQYDFGNSCSINYGKFTIHFINSGYVSV